MDQQPQPGQQFSPAPQVRVEDPGKTLGIVSIVLDVIGFAPVGLVLGVISKKKSRQAGFDGSLGNVGMIIGIIFTIIGVLFVGFLALISVVAYSGIQDRSNDASAQANANAVIEKADIYHTYSGSYPRTVSDFSKYPESTLDDSGTDVITSTPSESTQVKYIYCADGAQVTYFKTSVNKAIILPLGNASSTEAC